jgi:putative ABC transport system permease protein
MGVLAVMLLSVRERIREIGLRRALGARRTDIRLQFLLESSMLAAVGGAAGVVLGLIAAASLALIGPWDMVFPWTAVLLGLLCSTLLGLAIGVIPATRAAGLEPVEALRSS